MLASAGATGPAATIVGGGILTQWVTGEVGATGCQPLYCSPFSGIDKPNDTKYIFRGINGYDASKSWCNDPTAYVVNVSGAVQIAGTAYTIESYVVQAGDIPGDELVGENVGQIVFTEGVPTGWELACLAIQVGNAPTGIASGTIEPPLIEKVAIRSSAATGTIQIAVKTQQVVFYNTTDAAADFTVNLTGIEGSVDLDDVMTTGEALSVAVIVKQGATAREITAVTVDSSAPDNLYWVGGNQPASNVNSYNIVSLTIVKTGAATFSVFANKTMFA